jgi:hypothetical protein
VSTEVQEDGVIPSPAWTSVETHYNYFRDYDPATGRYIESDPIGLQGGINTYSYASQNPIDTWDEFGLSPPDSGGPYHPPFGTKLKCTSADGCMALSGKMWVLMRMINSHQLWDWLNPPPRGGGRHAQEIADLWGAYAKCQALHKEKCEDCPPGGTTSVVPLPEYTPVVPVRPVVPIRPMLPFEPIFVP